MRRLLGYIVKLPDGTRSPRTPKPVSLGDATSFLVRIGGGWIAPVFATRKPKLAPAEGAAEAMPLRDSLSWRVGSMPNLDRWDPCSRGPFVGAGRDHDFYPEENIVRAENHGVAYVRLDLVEWLHREHEAAVEAARREERERVLAAVRERVRMCLDGSDHPEASHAFEHVLDIVDDEEKGQAK